MSHPLGETDTRYCIIGAGPSGLAMAAAFRKHGVAYDHFERHSGVGGLWDLSNPGTPMYESAHFISSKTLSGFLGFAMPAEFPDYPRRDQVLSYLTAFAREHELEDRIEFGQSVEKVEPGTDGAHVTVGGTRRRYRGVVCASGVNWEPTIPDYEGQFSGEIRHAVSYVNAAEFEGKRVLIVGLGNSAADIACDAVRRAKSVTVSTRRGYHFIPKFIFGKPADVFGEEGPQLPLWLEQPLFAFLQRLLVGDVSALGMPKPDHAVLQSHPLLNDQLLHHLRHGDVSLKPGIRALRSCTVEFTDGSELDVDLILLATGYSRRIAYLEPEVLEGQWAAGQFLSCFSRRFPSLFTLGFAELNGALYPHLSRLADLVAQVARAQLEAPEVATRFFDWTQRAKFDLSGGRHLIDTPRHAHYWDGHALARATRKTFRHMRWTCP
jgi:cation diffusion facilitator CzcD-associated flavoprotein CzcO